MRAALPAGLVDVRRSSVATGWAAPLGWAGCSTPMLRRPGPSLRKTTVAAVLDSRARSALVVAHPVQFCLNPMNSSAPLTLRQEWLPWRGEPVASHSPSAGMGDPARPRPRTAQSKSVGRRGKAAEEGDGGKDREGEREGPRWSASHASPARPGPARGMRGGYKRAAPVTPIRCTEHSTCCADRAAHGALGCAVQPREGVDDVDSAMDKGLPGRPR